MLAQRSAGATAALADHHWLERLLQGGYGACFYLAKTAFPTALSPLYLLEEQRDLRDVPLFWLALIGVALATLLVTLAARRAPWLFAAWACYLVIVSPVLGLLQSGAQLVADRYSYIACMPWAVLLAAGLDRILRSSSEDRVWTRPAATAAAALVLVALTTLSLRQSTHWRTTLALWDQAVRADPSNYVARTNRANARLAMLTRRSDGELTAEEEEILRTAIADYDRSIALAPGYGFAHASRGLANMGLGNFHAAIGDFDAAIELVGNDPDMILHRGLANAAAGHTDRALTDFDAVLEIDPTSTVARANRETLLNVHRSVP
jgi:tetratricopeptide (TPR) repeat protein